jgi:hypothetical protein
MSNTGRYYVVVIREPDGSLTGLSRRRPDAAGTPFAGEWGALAEEDASALADAYNADARKGGPAEPVELFRYDHDPAWPDELA